MGDPLVCLAMGLSCTRTEIEQARERFWGSVVTGDMVRSPRPKQQLDVYAPRVMDWFEARGIPVVKIPEREDPALYHGRYYTPMDPGGERVEIHRESSVPQFLFTLVHEGAHSLLHRDRDPPVEIGECEAYMSSYIPFYILGWTMVPTRFAEYAQKTNPLGLVHHNVFHERVYVAIRTLLVDGLRIKVEE